jgi:hypothetical protein
MGNAGPTTRPNGHQKSSFCDLEKLLHRSSHFHALDRQRWMDLVNYVSSGSGLWLERELHPSVVSREGCWYGAGEMAQE